MRLYVPLPDFRRTKILKREVLAEVFPDDENTVTQLSLQPSVRYIQDLISNFNVKNKRLLIERLKKRKTNKHGD